MSLKNVNQKGFSAIEALLILVIVGIIGGTGYYVYHATQKSSDSYDSATSVSQSNASFKKKDTKEDSAKQNYVTIKEWGIRAPYDGKDTLTYTIDGDVARFNSKQLNDKYPDCEQAGTAGAIGRYKPSDDAGPAGDAGVTAMQDAAKNPSKYVQVGDYYYSFTHVQFGCADDVSAVSAANDDVAALVPKLKAVPEAH